MNTITTTASASTILAIDLGKYKSVVCILNEGKTKGPGVNGINLSVTRFVTWSCAGSQQFGFAVCEPLPDAKH